MDILDSAKQTFLEEARDLLQQLEDTLLHIESARNDPEAINALFRAAHTIKGSAGLFGFDTVVAFTHKVESVLDKVRNNELPIDDLLVTLLLSCVDHIRSLIDCAADGSEIDGAQAATGAGLLQELSGYLGQPAGDATGAGLPAQREEPVQSDGGREVGHDTWHISLRFGTEVLKNGMDPASFIRYLATLGDIVNLATIADALPAAEAMDPECCYLGFEITFKSQADKATIENVFDFVRDDCRVRILPPNAKISDYVELIKELPEDTRRLGEILIAAGTVTQQELDEALTVQRVGADGEKRKLGEILVEEGVVQQPVVNAALTKQNQVAEKKAQEHKFIKVEAAKLDRLINLVGELVIAGAGANLLASRSHVAELIESTSVISRLVEEIRDNALQLRMVQIGETFNRFNRVVRDVSKELGKDIALRISGAETELDKTVVEKIGDPLMHLVRNAMDHGIEPVDVRRAQGKPEKGTVTLNAFHDSGSIVIEVSDDGGGLKRDRIRQKAIEKGLIQPDQVLSDQDVYGLIMEPGFSTAESVTNLSGRGVGMDVVKKNIVALRGSVEIDSREGRGTTVKIRLPLTLAIIDGFLVGVDGSAWVVPLDMVLECVELTDHVENRNYINLRGEVLPFLRLRELFEIEGEAPKRENVVVVQYAGQKAGLVVDDLMGEFQTVIKPLGKLFSQLRGIGGSTILGSGEVALIVDVPALVALAANHEANENARIAGRRPLLTK